MSTKDELIFEKLNQSKLATDRRTWRFDTRVQKAAAVLTTMMVLLGAAYGQEKLEHPEESVTANDGAQSSNVKAEDRKKFPEAEFVASNKFRSFSYIQPLIGGLNFEGHYFGVEDIDVGIVNGSWTFHLGKSIKLSPGFGVYFGEHQRTGPALTFRWEVEKGRIFSQGLFIQGFRKVKLAEEEGHEKSVYPNIWDGNHVSLRYKRFEFGPSWERIHSREGNEWKGGGRVAARLFRNVSAVMFVMAPETEVRGGIIIHPARREE